jgi:hypothetical protein
MGTGAQHPSFEVEESLKDEFLIDSWKAVSLDPITSTNKTLGKRSATSASGASRRSPGPFTARPGCRTLGRTLVHIMMEPPISWGSCCRWISCRKNTGYHAMDPKI